MIGIYKITNPTGRIYIGQSKEMKVRERTYRKIKEDVKRQPKLYNSLEKYGWEAHTFEIIEECNIEDLNCRERYWQDFYDVLNKGLNCVLQDCGELKRVCSDETRKNISESKKGDKNPMFGKTITEEHKELNRQRWIENNPNKGKAPSDEQKEKMLKGLREKISKKVINTETGEVFNSIKEASESIGMNNSTLGYQLSGRYTNKTNMKLLEPKKI